MTFRTLIRRSLHFYARSHLGAVVGAAIGSAALIGALVIGDSVRGSLRERSLAGLGHGSFLLFSGDRLFSESLPIQARCLANVQALQAAWRRYASNSTEFSITINPERPDRRMLVLRGAVSREDGKGRVNQVQIIGISDFAPVLLPNRETIRSIFRRPVVLTNVAVVNALLANSLLLRAGDVVIVRFAKLGSLSSDAAISPKNQQSATLRIAVQTVATNGEVADFSPVPTMSAPLTIFVPLQELTSAAGLPQMEEANPVNAWLVPDVVRLQPSQVGREPRFRAMVRRCLTWIRARLHIEEENYGSELLPLSPQQQLTTLTTLLAKSWNFENVQIGFLRTGSNFVSLSSPRVFLDPPVVRAALAVDTNAQPVLTYLANLLRAGTNAAPYSMITAAGAPWTPAGMGDDEIIVSRWLADDLQVETGDEIALTYFGPESGAKLVELTNTFRVRGIVPMEMPWADRALMPDFPGIEKAESTRDWDAGFPLVYKIRQIDEDYWKQQRGTPKAFITLAAGQKMWANRFGNLTAIRFPIPTNFAGDEVTSLKFSSTNDAGRIQSETPYVVSYKETLEKKILSNLKPEELGLRFEPVREQALKAVGQSQDFGQLFLGFSFFLIVAALLLMAMLFQFGLEHRIEEVGTLLALGFTPKQVRRLLLGEGAALAFIGGVLGAIGGMGYAKAMLHGLTTIWRDAVGASALNFHITVQTLVIGLFASVVVSVLTIWLALRKLVKRPARQLLAGEVQGPKSKGRSRGLLIGGVALLGGIGLIGWAFTGGDAMNAGVFFGAGALVLIAGLSFTSGWLGGLQVGWAVFNTPSGGAQRTAHPTVTLGSLGIRGCARRRTRSISTVAMLACGSFLIVSIGVFRLDANRDATKRDSGTGGFALIGETTMPVVQDLNSQSGRNFFALNERDLEGVSFVPFRVHEGDEASCLNLNAAQQPRLLGVKPEMLEERFKFAKGGDGWAVLKSEIRNPKSEIEIPAIGDANSIQWAMHKKVGDTIDYVDERGQPFKVRIVGALANSILQGQLIIDEAEFVKRFPSESGYRTFLIDVPSNSMSQFSATLSRAMQDVGLELTPSAQRLAQFNAVQNTYLGTFQVLGGLGLLLGSVGLGIVVLRNVLERRGELAVLQAVGFTKQTLQRLILIEHSALLAVGLGVGMLATAVAVLPSVLSPTAQLPYLSLALTLVAVLVNGVLWTWVATRVALRGNLLAALRNE